MVSYAALSNFNVPFTLGERPIKITMNNFRKRHEDTCNPFNSGQKNIQCDVEKVHRIMSHSFGILPEYQQVQKEKKYLKSYYDFY